MIECIVFCEARADAQVAQLLADRVLCDAVPWADGILDSVRCWRGDRHCHADRDWWFVKWNELKKRFNQQGSGRRPRIHGRYGGVIKGEHAQARKAIAWTVLRYPRANAVILMRDDDEQGRRPSFEEARLTSGDGPVVVLALPMPEQESWSIVAFEPVGDAEHAALDELCADLGGSPHACAHMLKSKRDALPRGTKTVLARLTGDDHARVLRGLRTLPLGMLRERGKRVGLTDYLDEVAGRLAPLLLRNPAS